MESRWKRGALALRAAITRENVATLGGLCGIAALVWVAYLAGLASGQRGTAESLEPPVQGSAESPQGPPVSAEAPAIVPPPEVWTRMAGLNVWIAGRRLAEGDSEPRIVIMLHGFARPRETLLVMAEREATKFGTIFLFPEAPVTLDWRRRAWWRPKLPLGATAREPWPARNGRPGRGLKTVMPDQELITARRQILQLIGEVCERFNVERAELVLAGFSQGATLALDVALHTDEPLGGLAFLSGKPLDPQQSEPLFGRLRAVPVLVAHGRFDPVASFSAVDRMRRALVAAGVEVVWVPFDGGHDISRPAQWHLRRFIRENEAEPRPLRARWPQETRP